MNIPCTCLELPTLHSYYCWEQHLKTKWSCWRWELRRGVARIFQSGVTLCHAHGTYIVHCRCSVLKMEYATTYNLGQFKWKLGPPLPPISMMGKWARFGFCGDSSLIRGEGGGGGGSNFSFYFVQDCNLGQFKWKIRTTPPPNFNDGKMGAFWFLRRFIIDSRGGGV